MYLHDCRGLHSGCYEGGTRRRTISATGFSITTRRVVTILFIETATALRNLQVTVVMSGIHLALLGMNFGPTKQP
jgi:hypothetical protein